MNVGLKRARQVVVAEARLAEASEADFMLY